MGQVCSADSFPDLRRHVSPDAPTWSCSRVERQAREDTGIEEKYQAGKIIASKVYEVKHKVSGVIYVAYRLKKDSFPCRNLDAVSERIRALQRLDHPNICHLVEHFDDDPRYSYFVYSKARGLKLLDKIDKESGISEQEVARIGLQATRALAVGAEAGICHGALQPKNMHWSAGGLLELTDFGLAGVLKSGPFETPPDNSAVTLAPEVVRPWVVARRTNEKALLAPGEGICTPRADVWALGVIIFTLLTGRPPFTGSVSKGELCQNILEGTIDFSQMRKSVSTDARDFLGRTFVVQLKDRQTPGELLKHPWLRPDSVTVCQEKSLDVCKNLRTLNHESHSKKALMRMIAAKIPSSQIRTLEAVFLEMDENYDGQLTLEEFQHGLARHPELKEWLGSEIQEVFAEIDFDRSGKISLSEFMAATLDTQNVLVDSVLWECFKALDKDRNGYVTPQEMVQGVRNVDGRLGEAHVNSILGLLKGEVTRPMSFEDFKELVSEEGGREKRAESGSGSGMGVFKMCCRPAKGATDIGTVVKKSNTKGAFDKARSPSEDSEGSGADTRCPSSCDDTDDRPTKGLSPPKSPKASVFDTAPARMTSGAGVDIIAPFSQPTPKAQSARRTVQESPKSPGRSQGRKTTKELVQTGTADCQVPSRSPRKTTTDGQASRGRAGSKDLPRSGTPESQANDGASGSRPRSPKTSPRVTRSKPPTPPGDSPRKDSPRKDGPAKAVGSSNVAKASQREGFVGRLPAPKAE